MAFEKMDTEYSKNKKNNESYKIASSFVIKKK